MNIATKLAGFTLRLALGEIGEKAMQWMDRYYTDPTQALPKAIKQANTQTWRVGKMRRNLSKNSMSKGVAIFFCLPRLNGNTPAENTPAERSITQRMYGNGLRIGMTANSMLLLKQLRKILYAKIVPAAIGCCVACTRRIASGTGRTTVTATFVFVWFALPRSNF